MEPEAGLRRPVAFVIRVQGGGPRRRGQVVAVTTGASRLFDDLGEAMAFIEDQLSRGPGPFRPEADAE